MRKNIFELLSHFDIAYETRIIWRLFIKGAVIFDNTGYYRKDLSIMDCINSYSFSDWKSRNRSVSPWDMMKRLGIDDNFVNKMDTFSDRLLIFLEFIINMLTLCEIAIKTHHFDVSNEYQILKENINNFIEHFGYEKYCIKEDEQIIIIEKNPAAISAAEISEPEIANKIIQYNHYTLKGDIDLKKSIIIALASDLEPQRVELDKLNTTLCTDLFFMLNCMNIRHNNKEPNNPNYKPLVANMDNNTLEYWYDETYQMILLSKMLLDSIARKDKIKLLKEDMGK